ncbi:hypothetical protein N7520_011440 [Penicillium odoratum]|uniref:uncharacterized protein n=1 Tax=Penicillium odoratum TaxID=1167516 RepID=UPI002547D6EB|nr:uncharacterized protein N7520_011440 [Penicillium odoratum]KAJ5746258.1 hypothetical protein N7520_011440 [Penicillium odoratum]
MDLSLLVPADCYLPDNVDLCLLSTNVSMPNRTHRELLPKKTYSPNDLDPDDSDLEYLPAKTYSPDDLDPDVNLELVPAKIHPPKSLHPDDSDLELLPPKTYSPGSTDQFLLPAKAYSHMSGASDYGCHVSLIESPDAHSSTWIWPMGPEEVVEYRNLAEIDDTLIEIEMQDIMHEFILTSSPGSRSSQSPGSDESSIRALFSRESCIPLISDDAAEDEILQSLIPAGLNLPIKRRPENQPTLVNPAASKRPRSQSASPVTTPLPGKRPNGTYSITAKLNHHFNLAKKANLASQKPNITSLDGINESNEESPDEDIPRRKKLFGDDGFLGPHPALESPVFETPPLPDPISVLPVLPQPALTLTPTLKPTRMVSPKPVPKPTPMMIPKPIPMVIPRLTQKPASKPALFRSLSRKFKKEKSVAVSLTPPINLVFSTNHRSVSLNPTMQAKLYSDLEMMICTSANEFLLNQYRDGRVSQCSVNKVRQQWRAKNRTPVHDMNYDQATQRELIMENRRTLDFNGQCSISAMQFHASMQSWKVIAMEMSARTFCLPDTAIRKNLFEIQQILDMLNAPISTLRELNELSTWAQLQMLDVSEMSRCSTQSQMYFLAHSVSG